MELASILVALALVTVAYLYVSAVEGSYLNVFTPMYVVTIPTQYLLDIYHLAQSGAENSAYAYVLSYSCYAASTTAMVFAYAKMRMPAFRLPFVELSAGRGRFPAYVMLAAAVALFLPVMIEFRSQLADPRAIYMETRTGYGIYFFLSLTLAYLALILLLFCRRAGKIELTLFVIVSLAFVWFQGSKGHLLGFVFILAMYSVYVKRKRVGLLKFLGFTFAMAALGIVLFMVTTPGLLEGGLDALSGYSTYTRNGMMVIDSGIGPFYGRLTLENQVYPRIPRALDPGKPRDFGDFYLAEHFYPDAFAADVGAPAFSNGAWYADFGVMSLPLQLATGFLSGMMLKMFMVSLKRHQTPGDFIMVLFASGTPLISLGATFLLPESLLIAIIANLMYCVRLKRTRPAQPAIGAAAS